MPVRVTCPICEKSSDVADEWAGRSGSCSYCGAPITIPICEPALRPVGALVPAAPPPTILHVPPPARRVKQRIPARATAAVAAALVFGMLGLALVKPTSIFDQVAADAVEQYEITKRSGTAMDSYLRASMAAEAFLQAKDEANYQKWRKIQADEAKRAHLPRALR